jgi:hypothetical protein
MALRVKTVWFKKHGERPAEEVATVLASNIWRLADKAVDNLSKADYDIITPERGFKIIGELTCFLVHFVDRLAFDRMDDANARIWSARSASAWPKNMEQNILELHRRQARSRLRLPGRLHRRCSTGAWRTIPNSSSRTTRPASRPCASSA